RRLSSIQHLRPPLSTLFPYTTLFRSAELGRDVEAAPAVTERDGDRALGVMLADDVAVELGDDLAGGEVSHVRYAGRGRRLMPSRSEEHTSELQSPDHLVCRLLLEKKK